MLTLDQRIKRVRTKIGENQRDFGKRFNVDQSTISKWEHNTQKPESYALDLLAEIEAIYLEPA